MSTESAARSGSSAPVRLGIGIALAVVLGVASAAVWVWLADPAAYVVSDQGATLSEADAGQQAQVLVVYVATAAVVGLVLGVVAGWRARTWVVTPVLVVLTLVIGAIAWRLGTWWGPSMPDLAAARAASPGDRLPLPLGIGSAAPLLVWPIAGLVGLLLTATLRSDPEH